MSRISPTTVESEEDTYSISSKLSEIRNSTLLNNYFLKSANASPNVMLSSLSFSLLNWSIASRSS